MSHRQMDVLKLQLGFYLTMCSYEYDLQSSNPSEHNSHVLTHVLFLRNPSVYVSYGSKKWSCIAKIHAAPDPWSHYKSEVKGSMAVAYRELHDEYDKFIIQ
jgi:hypothetical protein